ncbi:MAG TPA: hypothetical protein VGY58_17905 [Gemmataceae bacterium]|nr:hypothetical protein [Gemmataceae bacterium]
MSSPAMPLEQIRVASPCPASWEAMHGNDRVRFCGQCRKNVYDLSALSSADAQALIEAHEGRLCVRFYQRVDGTILTADCPVVLAKKTRRLRVWVAALLVACLAAGVFGVAAGWNARDREKGKRALLTRLRQVKALEPIIEWLDPTPQWMGYLCRPTPPADPGPAPAPEQ